MKRGTVSLRPAAATDMDALCRLLTELHLPVVGVEEWWPRFSVAEADGKIVGVAGVETYADGALLRSVAVDQSMRGTGLGQALVAKALETAREAGSRDVYLLTTTANGYFPRFGFSEIPRDAVPGSVQAAVEFREACPTSAIVMHLAIQVS